MCFEIQKLFCDQLTVRLEGKVLKFLKVGLPILKYTSSFMNLFERQRETVWSPIYLFTLQISVMGGVGPGLKPGTENAI